MFHPDSVWYKGQEEPSPINFFDHIIEKGVYMTNLTNIFSDGIRFSDGYNHYEIIKQINRLEGIFSDLDDKGANWDIIWSLKGKISQVYAFFSKRYPVALVKENCPELIVYMLKKCGILIAPFDSVFSCDEAILKRYAPHIIMLDDRFLDDCNFSLDDEKLFYIYENIKYITPYSFTFDEIR